MRKISVAVTLAASGLFVGWAGQRVWGNSPDALWAAVAVISVLSASAIALNPTISRLLAPLTRERSSAARLP